MNAAMRFPTSRQFLTFSHFAVLNSVIFYLYGDANIMLISHLQSLYMTSFKTMMYATKRRKILTTLTSTNTVSLNGDTKACVEWRGVTSLNNCLNIDEKYILNKCGSYVRPYSLEIIYFTHVKNRILFLTAGENRISFVTFEYVTAPRKFVLDVGFLCTMKSHSSQVKKCMISFRTNRHPEGL